MSASNNYLAVLAHICNCSSSVSNRVAKKVLYPQYRGQKAEVSHRGKSLGLTCVLFNSLLDDF